MSDPAAWSDWVPIGLQAGATGPEVEWCDFTGIRLTDPFFYGTTSYALSDPARSRSRRRTPMEFLEERARSAPGLAPAGFIFHLSRCGSTLVSRVLASESANRVISEAPVIDQVLQWTDGRRLPALVSALGQPGGGERRLFIKFDSWHIAELAKIRAVFPRVPWIFLYRDPVEILVSQQRMPGIQMVPGMIAPERLGLDPATIDPAALGEYAARVLGQLCRAALANFPLGQGMVVNYSELPGAIWGSIARHFGLELTPEASAALAAAAEFDAKYPQQHFMADSAAKQNEATAAMRESVRRWLDEPYRQLEALRSG